MKAVTPNVEPRPHRPRRKLVSFVLAATLSAAACDREDLPSPPRADRTAVDRVAIDGGTPEPELDLRGRFEAVAALSERGTLRTTNRDRHVAAPRLGLFAVADGSDGKIPSEAASDAIVEHLRRAAADVERPTELTPILESASAAANAALPDSRGRAVGASAAAILFDEEGRRAQLANVGTSRILRLRDGVLEQLSQDQSLAAQLVQAGELHADAIEARHHFIPARLVGAHPTVEPFEDAVDVRPGDLFILHTDGLHRALDLPDIEAIVGGGAPSSTTKDGVAARSEDLQPLAQKLHEAAISAGSKDNLTIVLIRVR